MDFKKSNTKLGENICTALPLIEKITEKGMIPICVIGVNTNDGEPWPIHFATHSDSIDPAIVEMCRQLVEHYDNKNITPTPTA